MRTEEELKIDSLSDSDRSGRTSLVEIKEFIDCHYEEALSITNWPGWLIFVLSILWIYLKDIRPNHDRLPNPRSYESCQALFGRIGRSASRHCTASRLQG